MTKKASPITEIMRRDSPKYGHPKNDFIRKRKTIARYPKVKVDTRKMPEKTWNEIQRLYHSGWKINWISKKVGIEWHSVKRAVDDKYRKKRNKMASERIKRILADPVERKKQFARVDKWRRGRKKKDKRYEKWIRQQRRLGTQKYDATHREERRVKAIKRYNNLKVEEFVT